MARTKQTVTRMRPPPEGPPVKAAEKPKSKIRKQLKAQTLAGGETQVKNGKKMTYIAPYCRDKPTHKDYFK